MDKSEATLLAMTIQEIEWAIEHPVEFTVESELDAIEDFIEAKRYLERF